MTRPRTNIGTESFSWLNLVTIIELQRQLASPKYLTRGQSEEQGVQPRRLSDLPSRHHPKDTRARKSLHVSVDAGATSFVAYLIGTMVVFRAQNDDIANLSYVPPCWVMDLRLENMADLR